jgi:hypothetical protein
MISSLIQAIGCDRTSLRPQVAQKVETSDADSARPVACSAQARGVQMKPYRRDRRVRREIPISAFFAFSETRAMESLVSDHGQLSKDQAMVVVQLAKTSNLLFGGTANYVVAREFSATATYDEKLALMRCLFAV